MKPQYNPLKGEAPLEDKSFYSGEYLIKRKIETIPTLLDPLFPRVGSIAIARPRKSVKSYRVSENLLAIVLKNQIYTIKNYEIAACI